MLDLFYPPNPPVNVQASRVHRLDAYEIDIPKLEAPCPKLALSLLSANAARLAKREVRLEAMRKFLRQPRTRAAVMDKFGMEESVTLRDLRELRAIRSGPSRLPVYQLK